MLAFDNSKPRIAAPMGEDKDRRKLDRKGRHLNKLVQTPPRPRFPPILHIQDNFIVPISTPKAHHPRHPHRNLLQAQAQPHHRVEQMGRLHQLSASYGGILRMLLLFGTTRSFRKSLTNSTLYFYSKRITRYCPSDRAGR